MRNHKILFGIAVMLILTTVIFFFMFTSSYDELKKANISYENIQGKYKKFKENSSDSTVENLKEKLENVKDKYDIAVSRQDNISKIIETYIEGRYNYNGSTVNNADNIANSVKDVCSDDYITKLKENLSFTYSGNGGATDNFKHTAKIINMYISDIYDVGKSNDKDANEVKGRYLCDVFVSMQVNDSYRAFSELTLYKTEKSKWLITDESIKTTDL